MHYYMHAASYNSDGTTLPVGLKQDKEAIWMHRICAYQYQEMIYGHKAKLMSSFSNINLT